MWVIYVILGLSALALLVLSAPGIFHGPIRTSTKSETISRPGVIVDVRVTEVYAEISAHELDESAWYGPCHRYTFRVRFDEKEDSCYRDFRADRPLPTLPPAVGDRVNVVLRKNDSGRLVFVGFDLLT